MRAINREAGHHQKGPFAGTRKELVIATGNFGKVQEIAAALYGLPVELRSLRDFPFVQPPNETGNSYTENATIKANYYSRLTERPALADDSGLEVDALDGEPGIRSARFGKAMSDQDRIKLLLRRLTRIQGDCRGARFVCAISIVDPTSGLLKCFEGEVKGAIAHTGRGTNGFGYDSIFIPEGYEQTFGELSTEVKRVISHRARTLTKVREYLTEWLQ